VKCFCRFLRKQSDEAGNGEKGPDISHKKRELGRRPPTGVARTVQYVVREGEHAEEEGVSHLWGSLKLPFFN
jgi:hypothetical protein